MISLNSFHSEISCNFHKETASDTLNPIIFLLSTTYFNFVQNESKFESCTDQKWVLHQFIQTVIWINQMHVWFGVVWTEQSCRNCLFQIMEVKLAPFVKPTPYGPGNRQWLRRLSLQTQRVKEEKYKHTLICWLWAVTEEIRDTLLEYFSDYRIIWACMSGSISRGMSWLMSLSTVLI